MTLICLSVGRKLHRHLFNSDDFAISAALAEVCALLTVVLFVAYVLTLHMFSSVALFIVSFCNKWLL